MVLQYLGESLISLPDGSKLKLKYQEPCGRTAHIINVRLGLVGAVTADDFWNLDGVHFEPSAAAGVLIPDSQSLTVKMLISGSGCAARLSVRLIC